MIKDFLPINREDMKARGWEEVDFVYVIGVYCISFLQKKGYKMCLFSI